MKIGCVILAGGKSSRMGKDKALLEINGKNFIKQISDELECFEEKMIARGNNSEISDVSWPIIQDAYQERGPIGGLHAALSICESEALFCVSCDMPFIQMSLAKFLCDSMQEDYDAIVSKTEDGRIHPLCGVYRKSAAIVFEQQILSGNNRIMSALNQMRVKYITIDFSKGARQLLNVNTPKDYLELPMWYRL